MSGPSLDTTGFEDSDIARISLIEVSRAFEEPVLVKRFTGLTGGNQALGQAPTETYSLIKTKANISNVEARDINYPGSIYAIGDVKAEFRIPVNGAESDSGDALTAGRRSDRVIYRGREYRFIGHVFRVFQNYVWYYQGILRQVVGS